MRLILISAMQVDKAVLFSALITVAGFVPLFTMQGVEGQIFGPMARTYGYALAGALIATFTVTPVLASMLLPEHVKEAETIVVRLLHRLYNPALRFALRSPSPSWSGSASPFSSVSCISMAPRLGSEFLPHLEEGNFWIRASMPITLSLQDGEAAARKMREILLRHPEVITVVSQHGRPDDGSDASPFSNVELFAPLKPFDEWPKGLTKEKLTEQIQAEFKNELPGVIFNFSQYIEDNIEEGISGVKGVNSVKIVGPNLEDLTKLAEQVRDQMSQVRGVADLGIFPVLGQPNLNIKVDRAKAARYGLNSGDVNSVVQAAMGGAVATSVLEGDRQFDLVVRYTPEYRDSIEKIRNIKVAYQTSSGANAYIPLSELATITLDTGAAWIYHESVQRFIPVKFSVRGRDLGGTVEEAQQRIAKNVKLPPGYRLVWAGEFGDLQEAKKRLEIIVPISFVLIVGLLYSLFNNLRDCLLALAGIPVRSCWRRAGALCLRSQFQHLRRHRLRLALRRVRHGRHPDDYFLQPGKGSRAGARGRDVPRRLHPHAPPADDGAFGLHWPVSRGNFHGHRQPGAASARHGDRGRHAGRPRHAAARRARAENDISGP